MYSFQSRVRYSEVDSKKELTLPALMDYLQDCCTFQSEDIDVGVDYLGENHWAWVLSSWEIVIEESPKLGERIEINTWPYDFKGFYGYRNFTITDAQGNRRAFANSVWVFMDTDTMHPVKIAEGMVDAYLPEFGPGIEYQWSERKIKVSGEGKKYEPVKVQKFYIDTNHHMNNGKYVQVAEEYLPENFAAERVRVEYRTAAVAGDWLYPAVYTDAGSVTVVLADEKEKPYAVVQFIRSGD